MLELNRDPYVAEQQVRALTFFLVAFGYIDGAFDDAERVYIRDYLTEVARERAATLLAGDEPPLSMSGERQRMTHVMLPVDDIASEWVTKYHALLDQYDSIVKGHFSESVADGESHVKFVTSKLKLGCFELLSHLDGKMQESILGAVEQLMHADGMVHPAERQFFDEVTALVHTPLAVADTDIEEVPAGEVVVEAPRALAARMQNHPFFRTGEWELSRVPATFAEQSPGEIELVERVEKTLAELRGAGNGVLTDLRSLEELSPGPRRLDGRVYVQRPHPDKHYELTVLGDTHGCYSCMKAALLQADFFEKVRRHKEDPAGTPEVALVLLGDYIDRGRFGYPGTLRAALQLATQMPNEVVLIRGNHEFYVEISGRVVAPVRPCEALDSLKEVDGARLLKSYRRLFDEMPTSFLFGNVMFVHGGIPRDETLEKSWKGLESLNDRDLAFEMLWSDPADTDAVPHELQKEVARFGFGRKQFQRFMKMVGCRLMVRGHERVIEGFKKHYDDPEATLVTVFSAGGAGNADLPAESNYREVTPMALTITHHAGVTKLTPFRIDWQRYNDGKLNAFFADALASVSGAD